MEPDPGELLTTTVKPEWLDSARAHLRPRYTQAPSEAARLKLLLGQLLHADLNLCGRPTLPQDMQALHGALLPGGRLLLQCDEIVNIGAPARERYAAAAGGRDGPNRTLKLLLTDGVTQVAGIEYQRIPALHSGLPAGVKLAVQAPLVRRGLLLLTPANCWVLGGGVPRLEGARRRMVEHWNRPAVGRRGPPPSIEQVRVDASVAAWAEEGDAEVAGAAVTQALQQPPPGASQQTTQQLATQQQGAQWQRTQQQQVPVAPRAVPQPLPAIAALRPPQPAGPTSGRQAAPAAVPPPPAWQQQQQDQQPAVQSERPGFVAASVVQQQQVQQGQPRDGGHSNSFGTRPAAPQQQQQWQQQQTSQRFGHGSTQGAAAGPTGQAMQVANGGKPSVNMHKRSRLQLPKVEPAEQPQQQWQGFGGPAARGGPAGTAEDPICLTSDDEGPSRRPAAATAAAAAAITTIPAAVDEEQRRQQVAQEEAAFWQAGEDDDDWGQEEEVQQQAEAQQDPWEAGYDGDDPGAVVPADEEQLGSAGDEEWSEEDPQQQELEPGGETAEEAGPPAEEDSWDEAEAGAGELVQQQAQGRRRQQQQQQLASQQPRRPRQATLREVTRPDHWHPTGGGGKEQQLQQQQGGDTEMAEVPAEPVPKVQQQQPQGDGAMKEEEDSWGDDDDEMQVVAPLDASLLAAAPTLAQVLGSAPPPGAAVPLPVGAEQVELVQRTPPAAAAQHGAASGSSSDGAAAPATGNPAARPSLPSNPLSGKQQSRLAAAQLPPMAAAAAPPAPPSLAADNSDASSDDEMPQFGLLPESVPRRAAQQQSQEGSVDVQPFTYLAALAAAAAVAPASAYPLEASVWGVVRTFTGKLSFRHPAPPGAAGGVTEVEGYQLPMQIEDGTAVVGACLGSQFMEDLFDMPPAAFERQLADPATRGATAEVARSLQGLLASYCGLMRLRLAAPGAQLEVVDLPGALNEAQVAAMRAHAGLGCS